LKSTHFSSLPVVQKPRLQNHKDDEFLKQFDEHGNFRPIDPEDEAVKYSQDSTADDEHQVTYRKNPNS
jgi:hypothetical protein